MIQLLSVIPKWFMMIHQNLLASDNWKIKWSVYRITVSLSLSYTTLTSIYNQNTSLTFRDRSSCDLWPYFISTFHPWTPPRNPVAEFPHLRLLHQNRPQDPHLLRGEVPETALSKDVLVLALEGFSGKIRTHSWYEVALPSSESS